MDSSDFWTARRRLAAAKRQFHMQQQHLSHGEDGTHRSNSHLDGFIIEDLEVEEEIRPDFPCPYCYEELDVASLCSHLEDEHSCESKATVCPICSVSVARDVLSHIMLQHGHLLKLQRCRRLRRVPMMPSSQALSLLGKDLREAHLQVLLGGGTGHHQSNNIATSSASNALADPFLSSLFPNLTNPDTDDISKTLLSTVEETCSKSTASRHLWRSSYLSSLSREEREQRMRQGAGRAVFVQDLLISTLLAD